MKAGLGDRAVPARAAGAIAPWGPSPKQSGPARHALRRSAWRRWSSGTETPTQGGPLSNWMDSDSTRRVRLPAGLPQAAAAPQRRSPRAGPQTPDPQLLPIPLVILIL